MSMPVQPNSTTPPPSPSRRTSNTTSKEPPTQEDETLINPTTDRIPTTTKAPPQTPQSQNEEALYNYARSIARATPKRKHEHEHKRDRPSRNPALEDDSLALLLSWGGGEKLKLASVADVAADEDDVSGREGDGLTEDGDLGGDVGGSRTWESPQLGRILAVLVIFVLMVSLLLLWQGVLSILASSGRD